MSYDMHITRGFWAEAFEDPGRIPPEEWQQIADSDPSFEKIDERRYHWTNHPEKPIFRYARGQITIRCPSDDDYFTKLLEVAKRLGAVVQGDEGEYYRHTEDGIESTWEKPEPGPSG